MEGSHRQALQIAVRRKLLSCFRKKENKKEKRNEGMKEKRRRDHGSLKDNIYNAMINLVYFESFLSLQLNHKTSEKTKVHFQIKGFYSFFKKDESDFFL